MSGPHIFSILDTLKPTAEGMDRLPAWFLRLLVCSGWIAWLFNQSLGSSTIPEQWRVARIRPVAKMKTPVGPEDYSAHPVEGPRANSRQSVHLQAFEEQPFRQSIQDQFAFRPTGSTTAALIDLLQKTMDMLRDNEYIVIISVDFTRAFDRVRNHALSLKYLQLDLLDNIHNWLMDFFSRAGNTPQELQMFPHWLLGLMPPLSRALDCAHLHSLSKHLISIRGIVKMPCQSLLMTLNCWWVHRVSEILKRNSIASSYGQKPKIWESIHLRQKS